MSRTSAPRRCPIGHGPPVLVVEAAGLAVVQDLGRPGHGDQGLLVLLHGRLVTAGYPVPYVATSLALDVLGQARPGDRLELREVPLADAVARARSRREDLRDLAGRAATALRSSGLGDLLAPGHLGASVSAEAGGGAPQADG